MRPVVGGVDQQGVVGDAELVEQIEQLADVLVMVDHGVVVGRLPSPAAYRGGAFVGEHGSWNRPKFNGYKVVYVPFAGGRPSGAAQDVVTGFLDGGDARGRPVGLAVDTRGGLLIADDVGGAVWRVTAAGS